MGSRWLVRPQKRTGAELRLFCLPYAGGGVGTYVSWARRLPAEAELNAIQLPGRGSRIFEPAHHTMDSLMEELVPALEPYLDRPYVIFGHSLGSRVGLELMRQLKRRGWPEPLQFVASGSLPPSKEWHRSPIADLPRDDFLAQVRKFGGMANEIIHNDELLSLLLPALRADFSIADTYKLNRNIAFGCPASIFGGKEDRNVPIDRLSEWSSHFHTHPEIYQFPGGHFFIETHSDIVLHRLCEIIESILTKA